MAVGLLYRVWGRFLAVPQRQRVLAFQRGVMLCGEAVEKVVGPGYYWVTPRRTLLICDMRPTPFQVPAEEFFSEEGPDISVGLAGEYRILEPARFVIESKDAFGAFYLEIRQALRAAMGELDDMPFPQRRNLLTSRVKERLVPRAAQLGLELTRLDIL